MDKNDAAKMLQKFVIQQILDHIKDALYSAIDLGIVSDNPYEMIEHAAITFRTQADKAKAEYDAKERAKAKPDLRIVKPEANMH